MDRSDIARAAGIDGGRAAGAGDEGGELEIACVLVVASVVTVQVVEVSK